MAQPDDCPAGDPAHCPIVPNRRHEDPRWSKIHDRMEGFEAAMRDQAKALAENTTVTNAIKANTDEIVAFFQAGKGFFTVVRAVGIAAKWITSIAAAAVLLWALFKYGVGNAFNDIRGGK